MQKRFNFTQRRIETLPLPEKGRQDYYDVGCPKLTCRVSTTGNKSFVVLKKNEAGRTQRVTIGKFPDISVHQARELTRSTLEDISAGINPVEEKRRQKMQHISLGKLLEKYLTHKNLKPYTKKDYQLKFNAAFSDWAELPVTRLTRDMVLKRHNSLPGTATTRDNKMRILRFLMRYAVALKIIDEAPTDILKDTGSWSKPTRKNRIISSEQLPVWYRAVDELDSIRAKTYLFLLLYTGLRAGEALGMKWQDVNFKTDSLTVRDTKNHSDFSTHIAAPLKPYLRKLAQETGKTDYVFAGVGDNAVMDIPRWQIDLIIKSTGIKFSSHDLRRTFATIAEAAMLPDTLIKRLLNHATDQNVTTGYIRTEHNTKKQAIDRIADFIQQHIIAENENITPLKHVKQ